DHVFIHTEDGFDIYVDDNGFPCEEIQKVFTCRCRAWYIEYTVHSFKDVIQELSEELENELKA
ncbi:hypothetical protein, partial [Klebsiella pneumoniae]|uniref:hypothetical protein n=1 Tax=Klebsiella pneumoniae TaxID=573 RepID=UPI0038540F34